MPVLKHLLFESSSGYALFERKESDEIADLTPEVLIAMADFSQFKKMLKLKGFMPFTSADSALANINDVAQGEANANLLEFLQQQGLSKGKGKFSLGVMDPHLGSSIKEKSALECESNETVLELLRGVRMHLEKFLKGLEHGDLERSQVGLGHNYSRNKVQFNVNRSDNMIIQAIAILDQIDKDINTFAMRVKEWYSWHFPELAKIVTDMKTYVPVCQFILNKKSLSEEEKAEGLLAVVDGDVELATAIKNAAKTSMGAELGEMDMTNIQTFGQRVVNLMEYRTSLQAYLHDRMNNVAPNLTALIGEQVGARLISKAGSLTNLCKAPASTIQILGAEKALFRALKTKGNTPKYGLIYHSTFIGRAAAKNKGRISRYLANKCAIASRIDNFTDDLTDEFGKKMREQVEERLEFFNTSKVPRKNLDVMREVIDTLSANKPAAETKDDGEKKKKKKKRKAEETEETQTEEPETPKKKKKKDKKANTESEAEETPKKKKKKNKD